MFICNLRYIILETKKQTKKEKMSGKLIKKVIKLQLTGFLLDIAIIIKLLPLILIENS